MDAIVGGQVDDAGFPEVVMLRILFTNDAGTTQGFACTGTVITPTVVLTAAHCLDESGGGAGYALTGIKFHNLGVAPLTTSPLWVAATSWRRNPSWSKGSPSSLDIGAIKLPAPISGVTPSPYLNRPLVAADVGKPLEIVGFGQTSNTGGGVGTRRVVGLPLRGLTSQHLQVGDQAGKGICFGDSGGPAFLTERDGIRRVAGVASYTQPSSSCTDGLETRVDLYGSFIRQFLMDTGGASCLEDGLCASGCATVDPDCFCLADGTCNAQCPNLLSDLDCPADCVANGVCATQSCPRLDPDCHEELSACTEASQCQYRTCAMDVQRMESYCARPCSATCPAGTACVGSVCLRTQRPTALEGQPCTVPETLCLGGTTCTSVSGGALSCLATCATAADCATGETCVDAQSSMRVCAPKTPPVMDPMDTTPPKTGCAAAPGLLLALGALLLPLRRKSR